jgi:hypothetical protein
LVIKGQREGEGVVEWQKFRIREGRRERRRDKVRGLWAEDIERERDRGKWIKWERYS